MNLSPTGSEVQMRRATVDSSPPAWPNDTDRQVRQFARGENFPVAPRWRGRRMRADLLTVYDFARYVDELGDAPHGLPLLDQVDADLTAIEQGRHPQISICAAVAPVINAHRLDINDFQLLVEANRADHRRTDYETFDELLAYCALSAEPIGRIVLRLLDACTSDRVDLANRVCSGLQIVEHLQDVVEDYKQGRCYLPLADLATFDVARSDLAVAPTPPPLRALLEFEATRAAGLLDAGPVLCRTLPRRDALLVAGFVGGGRAALLALESKQFDVSAGPSKAGKARMLQETARVYLESRRV